MFSRFVRKNSVYQCTRVQFYMVRKTSNDTKKIGNIHQIKISDNMPVLEKEFDHMTGHDFDMADLKNYTIKNDIMFRASCYMNSPICRTNLYDVISFDKPHTLCNNITNNDLRRLMTELIQILQSEPYFKNLKYVGILYKSNYLVGLHNISSVSDVGLDFNIQNYKVPYLTQQKLYSYVLDRIRTVVFYPFVTDKRIFVAVCLIILFIRTITLY